MNLIHVRVKKCSNSFWWYRAEQDSIFILDLDKPVGSRGFFVHGIVRSPRSWASSYDPVRDGGYIIQEDYDVMNMNALTEKDMLSLLPRLDGF